MRKLVLAILGGIVALVAIAVITVVIVLWRFDANDHKAAIESNFTAATGHALHLDGNVAVTLYPWLGINIDNFRIDNAPGFGKEPLASVEHAEFRIRTWGIMNGEYEIDTVKLSGVRASLEVDERGNNNWTMAARDNVNIVSGEDAGGKSGNSPVKKFVLSGVDVHDIQLSYDDRKNKTRYELDNVNLKVGLLVPGQPFTVAATLRAKSRKPELQADVKLEGNALYKAGDDIYQLHPLQLDAKLTGATVPGGEENLKLATQLDIDNHKHTLSLQGLQLLALGAQVSSTVVIGDFDTATPSVKAEFDAGGKDLSQIMRVLGQDDLAARIRSLDSKFTIKASIDKKRDSLSVPVLKAELLGATIDGEVKSPDGVRMEGHLQAQGPDLPALIETAAILKGDKELAATGRSLAGIDDRRFSVKAQFTGDQKKQTASIPDLQLTALGLTVKGSVDANDFDKTPRIAGKLSLPPFNARELIDKLKPGTLHTKDPKALQRVGIDAEVSGTANSFTLKQMTLVLDDTRIKGSADISDLARMKAKFDVDIDAIDVDRYMAPTDTAPAAAKADDKTPPLPMDKLRELDLHGALKIGKLTISGLKLADIQVPLEAANGVIALAPMKASLYGGSFNGNVGLDATGKEATSSLTATLSKIDLGPLEKDLVNSSYLSGKGTVELALQAKGDDSVVLRRNLNGNGKLLVEDGVLSGTDIGATLMAVETMIRAKRLVDMPKGGNTRFNNFAATLMIRDGVVQSDDLLIKAPGWQVGGKGTLANLRNETLDFDLLATVDPTTATVNGSKYDIGGHQLPINCSGALGGPRCLPDIKAIASAALGNVKDKLTSLLKDKLEGKDAAANDASKNGAQTTPNEAKPAEKPAEKPKDKAVNLLKGLLNR